eukprot:scaffold8892_cov107-Isochrysis_galbana.AAC.4
MDCNARSCQLLAWPGPLEAPTMQSRLSGCSGLSRSARRRSVRPSSVSRSPVAIGSPAAASADIAVVAMQPPLFIHGDADPFTAAPNRFDQGMPSLSLHFILLATPGLWPTALQPSSLRQAARSASLRCCASDEKSALQKFFTTNRNSPVRSTPTPPANTTRLRPLGRGRPMQY